MVFNAMVIIIILLLAGNYKVPKIIAKKKVKTCGKQETKNPTLGLKGN